MSEPERDEKDAEMVEVPRALAEETLRLLFELPVARAYLVVNGWDAAVPGLIARS